MGLGENIKRYRKLNKMTQLELSEKIGRNIRTIRGYELGDVIPPLNVIEKIAEVFNVRTIDLIGSDEECLESSIEDLKEAIEKKEKKCITNLYTSTLDIIELVNYLYCGDIEISNIINNTSMVPDLVSLIKDVVSNRIKFYNGNSCKIED